MRKRIIAPVQQKTTSPDQDWLNVESLAEVEITSEDAAHPIESALLPGQASGWRAAGPGMQTIRHSLLSSSTAPADLAQLRGDPALSARKSTSCVGRRMAGSRSGKSCGSSGTSVPKAQRARRKIITSSSRRSRCSS